MLLIFNISCVFGVQPEPIKPYRLSLCSRRVRRSALMTFASSHRLPLTFVAESGADPIPENDTLI